MLQTAQRTGKPKTKKATPPHERFLEAFRWMLLARTVEEKLVSLYRGGLITGGAYIGEGGMQAGAFHEGMNIAAVEQVPLVVVATNNHYAYSTPNDREFACDDLVDRAIGYGFEGYSLDGTDLSACLDVIGGAVKRARAGRPPQLVVASVLRLSGHGEHDDASYVTDEIKAEPFARDCLKVAEQTIVDMNLLDAETLADWRKDAAAQVDEAISTAQKEVPPEGDREDWCAIATRALVDSI